MTVFRSRSRHIQLNLHRYRDGKPALLRDNQDETPPRSSRYTDVRRGDPQEARGLHAGLHPLEVASRRGLCPDQRRDALPLARVLSVQRQLVSGGTQLAQTHAVVSS